MSPHVESGGESSFVGVGGGVGNWVVAASEALMNDKNQLIAMLRDEFKSWEDLLAGIREEQITAAPHGSKMSIKDVIGHLRAWQQVSIARVDAALHNREPVMPEWLAGLHPEAESEAINDQYNEWIYEIYRAQTWASVHRVWREGFLRLLELAEQIPEQDLLAVERYPWLKGYALSAVLEGTFGHHQEHLDSLRVELSKQAT